MIIDCLACHKPVPVANGIRDTKLYEVMAHCGTCGSTYLIAVEQLQGPNLATVELDARRNKTS